MNDLQPAEDISTQLQTILKSVEDDWPISRSGIWNSSSNRQLSRHLSKFIRRCKENGQHRLLDLAQGLDEIVNAVIDNNTPPSDEEIDLLNQALDKLRDNLFSAPSSDAQTLMEPIPVDLLYLPKVVTENDPLPRAFDAQSWRFRSLSSLQALEQTLAQTLSHVLLVDTTYLGDETLKQIIDAQRKNKAKRFPEIIFLSEQSNIEIRLGAMRLGAKHLFTQPFDTGDLMQRLKSIIRPVVKAHPRVLIVEDDVAQARFAATLMQKSDITTYEIHNPLNVIDGVARFQPDLILMDLYMPGADGIELTRLIREHRETQAIPIVFLSGEDDPEKKLLALYAGADDFLTKPVRPQQLLATVNTRIERLKAICDSSELLKIDSATGLPTRRELLTRIDLACASTDAFAALLVCTLTENQEQIDDFDQSEKLALLRQTVKAVEPLIQKNDLLARSDELSFAILFQRMREDEIEEMGDTVYQAVSATTNAAGHDRLGVGMALIDGSTRHAHELLGLAESSAQRACTEGASGYRLHGEEPPAQNQSQTEVELDQVPPRDSFLHKLSKGLIGLRELPYSARHEHALETVELIPELAGERLDPRELAAETDSLAEFDRYLCEVALHKLGEWVMQGRRGRLILQQSPQVIKQADYVDFLKAELRRRQIVGTGLMIEFDLPALAADLKQAKTLMTELAALGISISLRNFACNETAYKVLAYLNGNAVRPHVSLLTSKSETIQQVAIKIHTLDVEIILPRVDAADQISLQWSLAADFIQAEFSDSGSAD